MIYKAFLVFNHKNLNFSVNFPHVTFCFCSLRYIEINSIFDLRKSLNYLWKLYFMRKGKKGKNLEGKNVSFNIGFSNDSYNFS